MSNEKTVIFYSKNPNHRIFAKHPKTGKKVDIKFNAYGGRTGRNGFGIFVVEDPKVIETVRSLKVYGPTKQIHENPKWLVDKNSKLAFEAHGKAQAKEQFAQMEAEFQEKKAKEFEAKAEEKAKLKIAEAKKESEQAKAKAAEERKQYIAEYSKLAQKQNTKGEWNPGTTKEEKARFEELAILIVGEQK